MTKKIIIDTDPGIDDAMAILFALKAPELELVGLTTIYGNVHTDLATQNALRLVELAHRPDIPVAHGPTCRSLFPLNGWRAKSMGLTASAIPTNRRLAGNPSIYRRRSLLLRP